MIQPRFVFTGVILLGVGSVFNLSAATFTLLDEFAPARALVPSVANGGSALGDTWKDVPDPSNIGQWQSGTTGVGYEASPTSNPNYTSLVGLDVISMRNVNGSVLARVPFTVPANALTNYRQLTLRMKYDDAFVAYINGVRVAGSGNAPANPVWNSMATDGRPDSSAIVFEDYDITVHLSALHEGTNMLALQGMNETLGSSDLILMPQLVASDVPPPPWPELNIVEVPGVGVRSRPVAIRFAHDGHDRMFIVEQAGHIRVLHNGVVSTFLDISDRVRSPAVGGGNEQGLLGLAFPPDFANKGYFYVDYTRRAPVNDGATVLSRFHLSPTVPPSGPNNSASAASEEILLTLAQPYENHNGGDVHFGPDGYLYFALGDGGSGGDPGNRAQNPTNLLGKMLRLDVESPVMAPSTYRVPVDNPFVGNPAVAPEIWALGLRNPWRWSFDSLTGDIYIGDVGQNAYEEIDFQPAGTGGLNYQWRRYEGFHDHNTGTAITVGVSTPPILETRRADGDRSITGGHVYRGSRFPRMEGVYIFADYLSGRAYAAQRQGTNWLMRSYPGIVANVATFGEDEAGNLYLSNLGNGLVYEVRDSRDDQYLRILSLSRDPANGRITFTFGAALGRSYQVLVSEDFATWTNLGAPLSEPANGDYRLTFTEPSDPPPGTSSRFFLVREN